jgi:hypothetical protein
VYFKTNFVTLHSESHVLYLPYNTVWREYMVFVVHVNSAF